MFLWTKQKKINCYRTHTFWSNIKYWIKRCRINAIKLVFNAMVPHFFIENNNFEEKKVRRVGKLDVWIQNWFVLNSDRESNGFNNKKIKKKTKYHTKKEIKQHTPHTLCMLMLQYNKYIVLCVDVDTIHLQRQWQQLVRYNFCYFSFYLLFRLSSRNVIRLCMVLNIFVCLHK